METRRSLRITLATATATALATAGGLVTLSAPQATAAPATYADDFNGDGYRDLVTSAPGTTVDGAKYAGAVVVNYGSASGISARHGKVITQRTSGIPGVAEYSDAFGAAVDSGDLNDDGYADLVVGAPGEDVGDDVNGGTAVVIWGSASGLSGARTVGDPHVSGHDWFGKSLAVGDFSGDGRPDLAVGSSGKDIWIHEGGFTKSSGAASRYDLATPLQSGTGHGATSLDSGDVNGDGADDLVVNGVYFPDTSHKYHSAMMYLGSATGLTFQAVVESYERAAVGDINGDGHDDVVVSMYGGVAGGENAGGSISTYFGSPDGIGADPVQVIDQDTPGVPGADEWDDKFGWDVSVDDIDGDGLADAAISGMDEAVGSTRVGSVTVLRGTAAGLSGHDSQVFHQGTTGVRGANEEGDRFGSSVRLADLDGDGHADLSVGAEGENDANGGVWFLRGSSSGVTTDSSVSFAASSAGLPTTGTPKFGAHMLP